MKFVLSTFLNISISDISSASITRLLLREDPSPIYDLVWNLGYHLDSWAPRLPFSNRLSDPHTISEGSKLDLHWPQWNLLSRPFYPDPCPPQMIFKFSFFFISSHPPYSSPIFFITLGFHSSRRRPKILIQNHSNLKGSGNASLVGEHQ